MRDSAREANRAGMKGRRTFGTYRGFPDGRGGRAERLKGFKSKAGRPYSAALVLDAEHKVRLEFGERS